MITRMPMARRPGLTLTEALVAMFVAALGMISLLTLFPLGALQMGQALKDSRTAEAARQADSLMRNYWRDAVEQRQTYDPNMFNWMNNPEAASGVANGSLQVDPTVSVSYPLFIDPIGENSFKTLPNRFWVTGVGTRPGMPRCNLGANGVTSDPTSNIDFRKRLRFCTLLDDLTYDETGTGAPKVAIPAVPVERGGRYNWLAIVQRPERLSENIANMTILVFDGRAPGYAIQSNESVYTPTLFSGTSLKITYATPPGRPPVSKGRWIALHTYDPATTASPKQTNILQFYRVVSANDEVTGTLDIELQTPIRLDQDQFPVPAPPLPPPASQTTRVIVFTGLSEVFERPQLTGK